MAINISLNETERQIIGLSGRAGGYSLRSITTTIQPEYITGFHKSIKAVINMVKEPVLLASGKFIRNNIIKAVDHYNNYTQRKDNVNINEVYHGLNYIYENNNKFTVKKLRNNMEKKIYYDIYNASDNQQKARMHANRSLKSMAFLNNVIGRHNPYKYGLTNQEFEIITKIKLGKDVIIPINNKYETNMRCQQCNQFMDSKAVHPLICPGGYGTVAMHNDVNKHLADILNETFGGVELEPRVLNEDNSRKRQDIILHNGIEFDDEIERIIIDTIIPSIYNQENIELITSNKNKIFSAGNIKKRRKENMYSNQRCSELLKDGYIFIANPIEIFGGINKDLKKIIDTMIEMRMNNRNKPRKYKSIHQNNFWVKFSTFFMKKIVKRIMNHVNID